MPGDLPRLLVDQGTHDPGVWSPQLVDWQSVRARQEQMAHEEDRQRALDQISLIGQAKTLYDAAATPELRSMLDVGAQQFGFPSIAPGLGQALASQTARLQEAERSSRPLIPQAIPGQALSPLNEAARRRAEEEIARRALVLRATEGSFGGLETGLKALLKIGAEHQVDTGQREWDKIAARAVATKLYADELNTAKVDILNRTTHAAGDRARLSTAARNQQNLADAEKLETIGQVRGRGSAMGRASVPLPARTRAGQEDQLASTWALEGMKVGPEYGHPEGTVFASLPSAERRRIVRLAVEDERRQRAKTNRQAAAEAVGGKKSSGKGSEVRQILDIFERLK